MHRSGVGCVQDLLQSGGQFGGQLGQPGVIDQAHADHVLNVNLILAAIRHQFHDESKALTGPESSGYHAFSEKLKGDAMLYRHTDKNLQKMEDDPKFNGGFSRAIGNKFRMRIQQIAAAENENDLRSNGPLHFEKLKGDRQHDYSIQINKLVRLIFQIESAGQGQNRLVITGMEDYH
jgi:plasmid maintenance system killer protein